MPKLIVLVCFIIAICLGLGLLNNQKIPVSNEKMTLDKLEKAYEARQALVHPEEHKSAGEVVVAVDHSAKGKKLYSAQCMSCHGAEGLGDESQKSPKLGGQFDWYTVIQLKAFKSGERAASGHDVSALSVDDMKSIGSFVQTL